MRSRSKVFKKYGNQLTQREGEKEYNLKIYPNLPRIEKFTTKNIQDPFRMFDYSLRTSSILDAKCSICGDTPIEMHHRRGLKQGKTDNTLKGISINLSRKQIPLCRSCHLKVHRGEYSGPSIY